MVTRRETRAEVEAAVLAELERVGPEQLRRRSIAERFADRAPQSTLYRWINGVFTSGRAGRHLTAVVEQAAAERAARTKEPAADAGREVVALAAVPQMDDLAGEGGVVSVMLRLETCVRAAEQVMKYARDAKGEVRNSKLLLAASDNMRKSVEATVRLHESVLQAANAERFHRRVIEVIAKMDRKAAEQLVIELRQLTVTFA